MTRNEFTPVLKDTLVILIIIGPWIVLFLRGVCWMFDQPPIFPVLTNNPVKILVLAVWPYAGFYIHSAMEPNTPISELSTPFTEK